VIEHCKPLSPKCRQSRPTNAERKNTAPRGTLDLARDRPGGFSSGEAYLRGALRSGGVPPEGASSGEGVLSRRQRAQGAAEPAAGLGKWAFLGG